jgi:DNA-binding transcriptional regulator YbjK
MSAREADQAAVLARVVAGTLRLGEGAELLGRSYRHAKRLPKVRRSWAYRTARR